MQCNVYNYSECALYLPRATRAPDAQSRAYSQRVRACTDRARDRDAMNVIKVIPRDSPARARS